MTTKGNSASVVIEDLTEKEKKLVEVLREIGYGQITVFLENGQPIRVVEVKKSIKL